ncbi:Zinc finger RNA-binding protein, partial [Varanus komodoensis]
GTDAWEFRPVAAFPATFLLGCILLVDFLPFEFYTMETEEHKPYNATPYYCNICKIYCASPVNLQTHFLGNKHKAVEDALKAHGIVKPLSATGEPIRPPESLPDYIQTEPEKDLGKTLEEQLNSCKHTEPALGLQYVTEYQSKENLIYECNLCGCQSGLSNMFMHVLGVKHRLAYLKRHYPEVADVKGRGSNLNKKLKEIAKKIEQDEGRKHIMVTKDFPLPKDDRYAVQFTDSLVTWFAEDDIDIGEKKKEDPKKDNATKAEEDAPKAEETNKDAKA